MQLPAEATFTLSSSYEATVISRLTRFTRKRCENGPTLHVPMVSCLMTPPSHNSVLRCSLLKDRLPSWLINFLLAAQFWGTIFYVSFVLPSTSSVRRNDPSTQGLIAQNTRRKGDSQTSLVSAAPLPWHKQKAGGRHCSSEAPSLAQLH